MCRYTLSRVTKSDKLVGQIHGSDDGKVSLCGLDVSDENWMIITNTYTNQEDVSCPACKQILGEENETVNNK